MSATHLQKMKIAAVALENCNKSALKLTTEKLILLDFVSYRLYFVNDCCSGKHVSSLFPFCFLNVGFLLAHVFGSSIS